MSAKKSDGKKSRLRRQAEAHLLERDDQDAQSLSDVGTLRQLHELKVHQIELELQNEELMVIRASLEKTTQRYKELFDYAPVSYVSLNREGCITNINIQAGRLLGQSRSDLIGVHFDRFVALGSKLPFNKMLFLVFDPNSKVCLELNLDLLVADQVINVETKVTLTNNECQISMWDVTERKKMDAELRRSEAVIHSITESSPVGLFRTNAQGEMIYTNVQLRNIFGLSAHHQHVTQWQHRIHAMDKDRVLKCWQAMMVTGNPVQEEYRVVHPSGRDIWVNTQTAPIVVDQEVIGFVGSIIDITERKQRELDIERARQEIERTNALLQRLAHFDALTYLPNRVLLGDRLRQAKKNCLRQNDSLAVAFLDLDGFKLVNDQYGHDVGDQMLVRVAQEIKKVLRDGDTLARVGGDEFVVVLVGLDSHDAHFPLLDRILTAASTPVTLGDLRLQVSASIGVTEFPKDQSESELLIRHADHAMYMAKQLGKNRYHIFNVDHDSAQKNLQQSIENVDQAFQSNELALYYQPQIDLTNNQIIGFEALLRWNHPTLGLLLPDEFLTVIENHSLSVTLDRWIIEQTLEQIHQWHLEGIDVSVSANVGVMFFQQVGFEFDIESLVLKYPKEIAQRLLLELLESTALQDLSIAKDAMHTCGKLGIEFALDDFGTGYSSLTYLRRLPFQWLKIDRSFIHDMLNNDDDLAIIKAVIGLSKAFNRRVIAEGVETSAQAQQLLTMGCQYAQGFGISEPLPANEVPNWIQQWQAKSTQLT